jgi:hypothetical protein
MIDFFDFDKISHYREYIQISIDVSQQIGYKNDKNLIVTVFYFSLDENVR